MKVELAITPQLITLKNLLGITFAVYLSILLHMRRNDAEDSGLDCGVVPLFFFPVPGTEITTENVHNRLAVVSPIRIGDLCKNHDSRDSSRCDVTIQETGCVHERLTLRSDDISLPDARQESVPGIAPSGTPHRRSRPQL